MSQAEDRFECAWNANPMPGAGTLVREYVFHEQRKWRFDFAWPSEKLAVEIDGRGPGHMSVVGFRRTCEKANAALLCGWRVLRFPATDMNMSSDWVRTVHAALSGAGDERYSDDPEPKDVRDGGTTDNPFD